LISPTGATNYEAIHHIIFSILVTSSLLDLNILIRTVFSNTHNVCSFLRVRDQVTHPHKTGKIVILCKKKKVKK
jgi:hypothetical protein